MPEPIGEKLRHIIVENTASSEPYTYPKQVKGSHKVALPPRNRAAHGQVVLQKLVLIRQQWDAVLAEQQAAGISEDRGLYLEFQSEAEFELAFKSLDHVRERIELLSVRTEDSTQYATVFVPHGRLRNLIRLVERYIGEDTKSGKPKNQPLVESITNIRRAALRSFWTDARDLFPDEGESIWWEVWLRVGGSREANLEDFREHAEHTDLVLKPEVLRFPDRTVLLAHGTFEQMSTSVELLDCIAELRKAKDPPSFYTGMNALEQMEWVDDLRQRMTLGEGDLPAVCILDTGVNNGHPLLQNSLADDDRYALKPEWGVTDHKWHGTEMAGLALLGDLTSKLGNQTPVQLEHLLESVKLLPPPPHPPNEPDLYGAFTKECVARAEIGAPARKRAICMAVTAPDHRDWGKPSSWSAAVDQLCAGMEEEEPHRRLVLISAGNVDEHNWKLYPHYQEVSRVQDPGQAWNALTVGGHTDKVVINEPGYTNWPVLATAGGLSPSSTTSVTWQPKWPNKPDIVMEAGNAATDPASGDAAPLDDLALLTTFWRPTEKLIVPTWGTSAATAQAARMAAILMSRYPDLWPETIRALMVHSAEWTLEMKRSSPTIDALLRRYGYGVPDLERACWSASNALTLVAQDELQPFHKSGSRIKTKDMNLHELPWPKQALENLGQVEVTLRVTLSYFIEPNPADRGWKYKHRYQSCGLRFKMRTAVESLPDFQARVSKDAQQEEFDIPFPGDSEWKINENRRNRGSIHSDIWKGPATDLAQRGYLAVFPVGGWWKERHHLGRWQERVRYALVVSIRTPELKTDIYTPVLTQVAVPAAVEVGIE